MTYISLVCIEPNNKKQYNYLQGKNCYNVANIEKQKKILHNFPFTFSIRTYVSFIDLFAFFFSFVDTYRITS